MALGLCCFARVFSSCRKKQGLLCCSPQASHCSGFSGCGAQALGEQASVVAAQGSVAHQLTYSTAYGIFPARGLNLCPLHRQAGSYPLCHQGSPCAFSEARLDHSLAIEMSTSPSPACLTTHTPSTRPTMFYSLKNKTKARAFLMARWLRICLPMQRIFMTQGLNPGLPYCRQILYRLSPQGSPTT